MVSSCSSPSVNPTPKSSPTPTPTPTGGQVTPTPTPTPSEPAIRSVTVTDKTEYYVGDVYNPNNVTIKARYTDGTTAYITGFQAKVVENQIFDANDNILDASEKFVRPGKYSLAIWIKYKNNSFSETININVKSGFEAEGYEVKSIDVVGGISFSLDHVVANEIKELELLIHWNKGDEYYTYRQETDDKGFLFSVKKEGDEIGEYINTPLEQNATYSFIISYEGKDYSKSFSVYDNYYKLDSSNLTFVAKDLDKSNAPALGEVKVLVIPVILQGEYVDSWTKTKLSSLESLYFGTKKGQVSFKSYFETASFGKMNVSGFISEPYEETDPELTDIDIQNSEWNEKLHMMFANAITDFKEKNPDVDLDEYDLDDDGYIDNAHFITNFNTKTYQSKTGINPWSTPLWPHRSSTLFEAGSKESPNINTYSLNSIDKATDPVASIHEQGHVFGLEDYYDYSYLVDYVGGADMQSNNIFDWNSFSKLSVGWVSPYVVTGPTEITISAASLNGDCIIVPADPNTFNNSAYDEYFLIELFSEYGNNANNHYANGSNQGPSWDQWETAHNVQLGEYGVRFYHVDATMQWWDSTNHVYHEATENDKDKWLFVPTNNDYYGGEQIDDPEAARFADFKYLSIIQASGTNTFGDPYSAAHYLSKEDLFHQGDVFTFNKYKHFLSKCGRTVTTMDNGESFPYKITFTSMSSSRTTVKIELA